MSTPRDNRSRGALGSFIFLSRWLQAPLYVGLIIAQTVYVYRFLVELWHLVGFVLLDQFRTRYRRQGRHGYGDHCDADRPWID